MTAVNKKEGSSCLGLVLLGCYPPDNYWINKAKIFQNVNLEFINKSISSATEGSGSL